MIFKSKVEKIVEHPVETDAMHIASFIGMERSDLLFYLAKVLQERNTQEGYRTVLLIDNSDSKDLFHIVNHTDDSEYTMRRITFVQDVAYDEIYFNKFAFVLVYHGMDVDMELINHSDMVVCSTNYNPNDYRTMKGCLTGYNGEIQMVYRDWISKKIKETSIEEEIGLNPSQIEMRSIIKADLHDYAAYVQLLQNGNQRVGKSELSELMLETVRYLAEKMTGVLDDKTMSKMIARAK